MRKYIFLLLTTFLLSGCGILFPKLGNVNAVVSNLEFTIVNIERRFIKDYVITVVATTHSTTIESDFLVVLDYDLLPASNKSQPILERQHLMHSMFEVDKFVDGHFREEYIIEFTSDYDLFGGERDYFLVFRIENTLKAVKKEYVIPFSLPNF